MPVVSLSGKVSNCMLIANLFLLLLLLLFYLFYLFIYFTLLLKHHVDNDVFFLPQRNVTAHWEWKMD